jgi:hypothetical protein
MSDGRYGAAAFTDEPFGLAAWSIELAEQPVEKGGADGTPVSLETYRRQIHLARLGLDRAAQKPGDAGDVERVANMLRHLGSVRLPGGQVLRTDSAARAAELLPPRASSTRRIAAWLHALDTSLQQIQPRSVSTADLAQLDVVLRDARFHPFPTPWEGIRSWIDSLYRRVLRALAAALRPGSASALIPASVLLVLVALVGFLLARGAMGKLVVERAASEEEAATSSPESAARRADELAAAGNLREALRYLFLSTMLQLQAHGLVELRPGMTNREYLRTLAASRPLPEESGQALQRLIDTFDAVWYGHREIGTAEYRSARAESEQIVQSLRERAA